jgi:hypothetical protein
MVPLKLTTAPDRNRSKQKHDEKMIYKLLTETDQNKNTTRKRYTDLGDSGELYRRKFNNKRMAHDETGSETSSKATTQPGGAASKGPAPWYGVVPPGTVSYSFSSRNFSYLIKNNKSISRKV